MAANFDPRAVDLEHFKALEIQDTQITEAGLIVDLSKSSKR